MANAFANHNSRNFWKEVRNINRSCSCKSRTPVIDGFHGADNIETFLICNNTPMKGEPVSRQTLCQKLAFDLMPSSSIPTSNTGEITSNWEC